MANRAISKVPVDKEHFMNVLKSNKTSIRKLGTINVVDRNERTIRRYLNDECIPYYLLSRIAEYLSISTPSLSGYPEVSSNTSSEAVVLTQEELEWLQVMRNLKNKTVDEVIDDLIFTGSEDSAFTTLHHLYTDDEDEDEG